MALVYLSISFLKPLASAFSVQSLNLKSKSKFRSSRWDPAASCAQQHLHGVEEDAYGGYDICGRDWNREYGHAGDEGGSYYEAE
ncbi:hypothetical protein C0995_003357, partial [Termitomyces sp. Mi166